MLIFFSAKLLLYLCNKSHACAAENNDSGQLRQLTVFSIFLMKMELISFFLNTIKEYIVSNETKPQPEKRLNAWSALKHAFLSYKMAKKGGCTVQVGAGW